MRDACRSVDAVRKIANPRKRIGPEMFGGIE